MNRAQQVCSRLVLAFSLVCLFRHKASSVACALTASCSTMLGSDTAARTGIHMVFCLSVPQCGVIPLQELGKRAQLLFIIQREGE
jgi:hypothetical protein